MASFRKGMRHSRYKTVLTSLVAMPIIAVLGFLDVIPVSNTLAWVALAAFVVGLIVFFTTFNGKNPADETD
ncbi:hypothetical protein JCM19046_2821 [Bacillus sp. JCM 19046]|nr:hypothetical protein JCM19045_1618 [Bacillus sp. JCM 19045]GAF18257.1 hypothetical protein JCM19046_2821 [Bacillus sp. JCM 19046]